MKTNKNTQTQNNNLLDVLDQIEEVKVSPFFKNKVLNQINREGAKETSLHWFTPQLQLATLAIVVCINAFAIYYSFPTQNSEQNISSFESFVEEYYLGSDTSISIN